MKAVPAAGLPVVAVDDEALRESVLAGVNRKYTLSTSRNGSDDSAKRPLGVSRSFARTTEVVTTIS